MPVDSYKWLPPSLKTYFANMAIPAPDGVPWATFDKPLAEARIALVTTAGINVRDMEPPFDYDREWDHPMWGDPTYRTLPRDLRQEQVQTGHLHINNDDLDADVNIGLPVHRMLELESGGVIGSLASRNFSFMGYQPDTTEWRERYAPEVAAKLQEDAVDGVLLTPV
jgi:D-proline reductase (dithiol) PrdB